MRLERVRESGRVIGFNYMAPVDGWNPGYASEPYPTGFIRTDGSRKPAADVMAAFTDALE